MATKITHQDSHSVRLSSVMTPRRFREFLQRLGPIFVKVGQFLALRPDLIAQEYCNELLELTDRVETFPYEVAREIIRQDLGGDPEKLFSWIDSRPLAAGSLAQVHRARTLNDEEVVIKVQRPNIHAAVQRDLRRARLLVRILNLTRSHLVVSPSAVLDEITRWLHDELDVRLELRNLTRMYQLAQDSDILRVPTPYPELSGNRVVTAEYLPGVPLSDLLKLIRDGRIEEVDDLGLDRAKLAENLLYTVLEQIFRYQFFHADTHPGNVLAMSDNSVGFIDFGLADTLDPNFRKVMMRLLSAIYSDDFESMFQSLVEVLVPGEDSDLSEFRADFFQQSRRWQRERDTEPRGVPRSDSPVARYMVGVLRAARRNHFRIPTAILSMYRALLTAEIVAGQLGGDVDLAAVGRKIFERIQIEQLFAMLRIENWQPVVTDWIALLRDGPRQTHQVINDLLEGQLVLRVHTSESDEDQRLKNLRARLISLSIVSLTIVTLLGTVGPIVLVGALQLSHLLWASLAIVGLLMLLTWKRLS